MGTPPLDQRELNILRGMIDEYMSSQYRRRFRRELFEDSKMMFAMVAATVLFLLNLATLILLLRHFH